MTPAGIERATLQFVAQHLNHSATAVPSLCCSCSKMMLELKCSDMLGDMCIWFLWDVICHWASILVLVGCDAMSLSEYFGSCAICYVAEQEFWFLWDVISCRRVLWVLCNVMCRWASILVLVGCGAVSLSEYFGSCAICYILSKNFGSCGMWYHVVGRVFWVLCNVVSHWASILVLVGCNAMSSEYFGSCAMWYVEQEFWFLWDVMPCRVSMLGLMGCDILSLSE